jgi:catechol 2,3-dioxygenase-like lactoylglutathione lyase family enzyme
MGADFLLVKRALFRGYSLRMQSDFHIHGLDHVQLAMPAGEEARAREFYGGVLGLTEVPKPPNLAARGGVWFEGGSLHLHLGVEADFRPAKKAHPALLVKGLEALARRLEERGVATVTDEPLAGYRRFHAADPFGNRLEFLEPIS